MKRHSGPYSHVQKIGKLSSVAPGEQCNDTLRSCHLHQYGGSPSLVVVKMGLPGIHPITQLQRRYSMK